MNGPDIRPLHLCRSETKCLHFVSALDISVFVMTDSLCIFNFVFLQMFQDHFQTFQRRCLVSMLRSLIARDQLDARWNMNNTYGTVACVLVLTAWTTSTQSFEANIIWLNDNVINCWPRDPAHRNKPVLPLMLRSNWAFENQQIASQP